MKFQKKKIRQNTLKILKGNHKRGSKNVMVAAGITCMNFTNEKNAN